VSAERKWSGASRKSGEPERSSERAWQKRMERERSAEREVAERERRGENGLQNMFERGAAFLPLTLRSHALIPSDIRCIRKQIALTG